MFRRWLADHRGILVRIAAAFAGPQDRDDLLQEMMMALWHAVPRFRGEAAPGTFIYRVVQNTALVWHRSRRRRPFHETLRPGHLDRVSQPESPAGNRADRERMLYDAIRQLPELDRVMVLMQLDGAPYREIAASLGLSESNVGVRLSRARGKLAHLIGDLEQ